jgi:hypothetical protein
MNLRNSRRSRASPSGSTASNNSTNRAPSRMKKNAVQHQEELHASEIQRIHPNAIARCPKNLLIVAAEEDSHSVS